MNWINDLLWAKASALHTLLSFVIAAGYIRKIKVFGVSWGSLLCCLWGSFKGISVFTIKQRDSTFLKSSGIDTFVYSVGMQSDGFFSSFNRGDTLKCWGAELCS